MWHASLWNLWHFPFSPSLLTETNFMTGTAMTWSMKWNWILLSGTSKKIMVFLIKGKIQPFDLCSCFFFLTKMQKWCLNMVPASLEGQKPQTDDSGTGSSKEQRTHSIDTSPSLPFSGHLEKTKEKKNGCYSTMIIQSIKRNLNWLRKLVLF